MCGAEVIVKECILIHGMISSKIYIYNKDRSQGQEKNYNLPKFDPSKNTVYWEIFALLIFTNLLSARFHNLYFRESTYLLDHVQIICWPCLQYSLTTPVLFQVRVHDSPCVCPRWLLSIVVEGIMNVKGPWESVKDIIIRLIFRLKVLVKCHVDSNHTFNA